MNTPLMLAMTTSFPMQVRGVAAIRSPALAPDADDRTKYSGYSWRYFQVDPAYIKTT
jgi:hypothetical protein